MDQMDRTSKLRTQSMVNVVRDHGQCHNVLPLLSRHTEYDLVFHPDAQSISRKHNRLRSGDHEEKEKEEDSTIPKLNLWYLQLHEMWTMSSAKIKAIGVRDYHSAQWVTQSETRSLEWSIMTIPINGKIKNNRVIR